MDEPISIADMIRNRPRQPDAAWFQELERAATERSHDLGIRNRCAHPNSGPEQNPLERAGVPPIFHRAKLDDFPELDGDVARFHRRIADPTARNFGLAVYGPPGTGKTHLGAALVRDFLDRGRSARFIRARRMQRLVFDAYSTNSEPAVMGSFVNPELLVIDDLGYEGKSGDAGLGLLLEVLDDRLGWKRATVVTMNLTREQALVRYNDAIVSRLSAMQALMLGGRDRRQGTL